MYRNTYLEINLSNIEKNVNAIIERFSNYKYYIGVVKADCYGHNDIETVKAIIRGGCNYLAVATLDEALEIRKYLDIPILCLGIIPIEFMDICLKNNITVTISSLDYLKEIINKNFKGLKVHIKINTGMNRLGISNKKDFDKMYYLLKKSDLILEGIYSHIYNASNKIDTLKQFNVFEDFISSVNWYDIPIIHLCASDATFNYDKLSFLNGCRLGIGIYGLTESELSLLPTMSLYSEVIQINDINNQTVGYNCAYKVLGHEKVAVVSIGYEDGIIRKNTGRNVYINDKPYKIVGNICMDMLFIQVDDLVKVGDRVEIIKDINHIKEIAKHLDTITYEVICSIGKRVPRVYIK